MPFQKSSQDLAPPPSRFLTLLTFVIVVAVLRIAEEVMIPVALALLLAFLLSPLVVRLTRWRLPKPLAITVTVALAFGVMTVAAWQITSQAMTLLDDLPRYEDNLQKKIAALKQPQATGSLSRAFVSLEKMWRDLQAPAADVSAAKPPVRDGTHAPVAVEVQTANRSPFEVMREIVAGLFGPLSRAGIVVVFVIAILFQREDLRSRFIRVISGGQLNVAIEAVDDAAQRVSRYLFAQLLVNTCFGLGIGIGLYFIGIPHAALWGLLSTLLRFIPFLGPLIAVVFPLVLALAVDPGWSMLFWTAGLFIAAELVTNNLIEVWVYGTSTGISTLALLTAAVFWSWLWGAAGLFLSTPLTVCLLVLGQYVPGLKFLGVLLGSEPPLVPSAEFYRRMLSMDHEEMFKSAETYVAGHSLTEFYDDVFVPALLMSEIDRHNGVLAEMRQKFIFESSRELIEDLSQRVLAPGAAPAPIGPSPAGAGHSLIIGLPARDEADELVALMLAHLLAEQGLLARVTAATAAPDGELDETKSRRAIVFVSALPPSTLSAAARVCRQIKQVNSSTTVLVGVWHGEAKMDELKHRFEPAGADQIVLRLSEAVAQLKNLVLAPAATAAPNTADRTESLIEPPAALLSARTEIDFAKVKPEEAVDMVLRELARTFDVPVSLVSLVESDPDFWRPPAAGTASPMAPPERPAVDDVLASEDFLFVEDLAKDERLREHALLAKRGVRFLAIAPLRTRGGHRVGNLCVLDTQPRKFNEADRELLASLGAQLMATIDPETAAPRASSPGLN